MYLPFPSEDQIGGSRLSLRFASMGSYGAIMSANNAQITSSAIIATCIMGHRLNERSALLNGPSAGWSNSSDGGTFALAPAIRCT